MRPTLALGALLVTATALAGCSDGGSHGHGDAAQWRGAPLHALPQETIDALAAGEGMGYALAAERNGYPGPKHVLELQEELALTQEQRQEMERLVAETNTAARTVGARLLDAHAELEAMFARGTANAGGVQAAAAEVGNLEGTLRRIHLVAHVQAKAVLTPDQVAAYYALRH